MLKLIGFITYILLYIYFNISFAIHKPHNIVIIDVGSSGTRIHLFSTDNKNNHIIEVFHQEEDESVVKHQYNHGNLISYQQKGIKNLINFCKNHNITATKIPLYMYGTAGMRNIAQKQQKLIYQQLTKNYAKYHLFDIHARTISGSEEGLFDWLSLNLQNIQQNKQLNTSFDIGGRSMQLTMASNKPISTIAIKPFAIKIKQKQQFIYSVSINNYGFNAMLNNIQHIQLKNLNSDYCFPEKTYEQQKFAFNYDKCDSIIHAYIKNNIDKLKPLIKLKNISQLKKQKIIAFAGIYYLAKFFKTTKIADIPHRINAICQKPYSKIQQENPKQNHIYLKQYCFNAVYATQLLNTLIINDNMFSISNKNISWSKGAAWIIMIN